MTQTGANVVGQKVSDGTDTLRNIEVLKFSDETVTINPVAAVAPTSRSFAVRAIGSTSPAQTVTLSNTGTAALSITGVALTGANAGDFAISANGCGSTLAVGASCTIGVTFRPTAVGPRSATLEITDDSNGTPGSIQQVALSGTGGAGPSVNSPATGGPVLSNATPQVGDVLTVDTSSIADADGLGTLRFQWQQTAQNGNPPFTDIPGETGATLTVPGGVLGTLTTVGRRYRVVVSFIDLGGNAESLTSAPSARVTVPLPTVTPGGPGSGGGVPPIGVPAGGGPGSGSGGSGSGRPAAPALRVSGLTVSASGASRITVAANVPAGARAVRIRVFRLTGGAQRAVAARKATGRKHIATVFRHTPKAKRYVFRLTEKALRHLKPGRYLIEVRVGTSRAHLGPATSRIVTVRRPRA